MRLLSAIAALCVLAAPALADCTIPLEGSQEVPPVSPSGRGEATIVANSVTRQVTLTGSYSGMTSNVFAAHIHFAPAGANGGVILALAHTGGTMGTLSGGGILSQANFDALLAGNLYVNVHTNNNGGGEIRGQIDCLLIAADISPFNGTGVNPNIYTSGDVPQLGQTFDAQVDITGAQATLIGIFLGPPIPGGVNLGIGQLLCAPPYLGADTSLTGDHSIAIPANCALMGVGVCTQGGTVVGGQVKLANAIQLRLGI